MIDTFKDIVPSILVTKENVMKDPWDHKEYKPFLVNRALSYHLDCLAYVDEMNRSNADPDMQYQFLLHSVRGMKRNFKPWQKKAKDESIEMIMQYFNYSHRKAQDALRILTDEQLAEIKFSMETGGIKK